MASNATRAALAKRGAGIGDLSDFTVESGEYNLEEAVTHGMYQVNCTHQIGIATATEVGLSSERFPIRVIINSPARAADMIDTVCRYWRIVTASGVPVPFQRKPLASDAGIRMLYSCVPELDDFLWSCNEALIGKGASFALITEHAAAQEALMEILLTPNPTDDQRVAVNKSVCELMTQSVALNRFPYFKVGTDCILIGEPHGVPYDADGSTAVGRVTVNETAASTLMNYTRFKTRYPTLSEGIITTAATCVTNMFRYGLFEAYEHKEFYTVCLQPVPNSSTVFTINSIISPRGAPAPSGIVVGGKVDIAKVKFSPKMHELASCLVWGSGLNHYLFNHTTGGSHLSGSMVTALGMYGMCSVNTNNADMALITNLLYEALHPSNKRAIANLFFKGSGVTTHGRMRGTPQYQKFVLDQFTSIRSNPYPAGSHKAYVCLMALKRVLQAGLGAFLPWASEIDNCIKTARETLKSGARAHIGSSYYTGDAATTQSSALDNYLPELAFYVQNFNRGDSLCLSPHVSPDVSARASMNWANLLRELRAKDVSAVKVEVVKEFLTTQGAAIFSFDPDDKSTWTNASKAARVALDGITAIFT